MALRQSNRGNGNRKSSHQHQGQRDVGQELLDTKPEFRARVEERTGEAWKEATDFLMSVVKGEFYQTVEVWDKKNDRVVEIIERPSVDMRVRAAKVLKEYTLDKTLADKKDKEGKSAGEKSAAELMKALQEIEHRRREDAERKAVEAGKLAKMPEKKGAQ